MEGRISTEKWKTKCFFFSLSSAMQDISSETKQGNNGTLENITG